MQDTDSALQDLIAPFFDVHILSLIRSNVMMQSPLSPYSPEVMYNPGMNMSPLRKLWQAERTFILAHRSRENFEELRQFYCALDDKANEFESKIRDLYFRGMCRCYVWAKDASSIWTTDHNEYGLLYQAFGDVGVYYILHLNRKTIVFVDHEDIMDQAIEELRQLKRPVYTEFPWPTYSFEEQMERLRGNIQGRKVSSQNAFTEDHNGQNGL